MGRRTKGALVMPPLCVSMVVTPPLLLSALIPRWVEATNTPCTYRSVRITASLHLSLTLCRVLIIMYLCRRHRHMNHFAVNLYGTCDSQRNSRVTHHIFTARAVNCAVVIVIERQRLQAVFSTTLLHMNIWSDKTTNMAETGK